MDYHFNSKTIVQLIHLLKDQKFSAHGSNYVNGEFKFKVVRVDSPNEDEYWIVIRNVSGLKNLPAVGLSNDTIKAIEYNNQSQVLSIHGEINSFELLVNAIDVSALGT